MPHIVRRPEVPSEECRCEERCVLATDGGRLDRTLGSTGPMFMRYNAALRGLSLGDRNARFRAAFEEMGRNRYCTTLHVINVQSRDHEPAPLHHTL